MTGRERIRGARTVGDVRWIAVLTLCVGGAVSCASLGLRGVSEVWTHPRYGKCAGIGIEHPAGLASVHACWQWRDPRPTEPAPEPVPADAGAQGGSDVPND